MPTQTITITVDTDDGYREGGTWAVGGISGIAYVDGPTTAMFGVSFQVGTTIPAGATINAAYFRAQSDSDQSGSSTVNLLVENVDPATNTIFSSSHLPAANAAVSARTVGPVTWAANTNYFGLAETNPTDIGADIAALLASFGEITAGQRINVWVSHNAGAGYTSLWDSSSTNQTQDTQLFIDWTEGGGPVAAPPVGRRIFVMP